MFKIQFNHITNNGQMQLFDLRNYKHFEFDKNSPVEILNELAEELVFNNKSKVNFHNKKGRKSKNSLNIMFKIILLSAFYSELELRKIIRNCHENINFIYLLNGEEPPKLTRLQSFMTKYREDIIDLHYQFIKLLKKKEYVNENEVFIDGTKIEAFSNKYTFVWKGSIKHYYQNNIVKIERILLDYLSISEKDLNLSKVVPQELIEKIILEYNKIRDLKDLNKKQIKLKKIGSELEKIVIKQKEYEKKFEIMGNRNSYSKTDTDATFMRSKKDHMNKGQLIPAYNIQSAVNSTYIVDFKIFQNPTDFKTLIPFIQKMESNGYKFKNVVADAGYESYENLKFLSENSYTSYIKPKTYEKDKKRKEKNDIKNIINLTYDKDKNEFLRKDGVIYKEIKKYKYRGIINSVFEAQDEEKHSFTRCIEDYLLKFKNYENVISELGTKYRLNRSIQVERPFGDIGSY